MMAVSISLEERVCFLEKRRSLLASSMILSNKLLMMEVIRAMDFLETEKSGLVSFITLKM